MLSEKLNPNKGFAKKFFESALSKSADRRLAHAYMLTGSDTLAQYYLVMQIAKVLNCQNHYSLDNIDQCTCTSCSWIKQNRHPGVITISPIDYISGKESKSKTVISVDQAKYLRNTLATSSQYYRVVIFTDAVEGKEYEARANDLWKNYRNILNPPPIEGDDIDEYRSSWIPQPVTYRIFQSETANSLLKTLEEPGSDIVFFFLTKDKEDMLDTIVSRCQAVPVASENSSIPDMAILNDLWELFPPKDHQGALLLTEKLIDISKQESCNIADLLDLIQEYLRQLIISNSENNHFVSIFIDYIEKIEKAKLELTSYVSPQAVLDSLFLSLIS